EFDNIYNITIFGSPQEKVGTGDRPIAMAPCASGCNTCPTGSDGLGLTCEKVLEDINKKISIRCNEEDSWCSWAPLVNLDFVHHKTYYWEVSSETPLKEIAEDTREVGDPSIFWEHEFEIVHISPEWTEFSVRWYYVWMAITVLVMFLPKVGFFYTTYTCKVRPSQWSGQQSWVAVLLVWLFFFNNPFFAGQVCVCVCV
ncbi:unnamed protein product, partial [Discosporangium mesarthrocarpum]